MWVLGCKEGFWKKGSAEDQTSCRTPTSLTARAAWDSPTTPVSHLFAMFEQMCAQIHDVLLSPIHSCRGVLLLQVTSMIQSPLNVMEVCFPWQRAGEWLNSKGALSTCTLPPAPRAHSASSSQSSQRKAVVKAAEWPWWWWEVLDKMISATTGLKKWYP